MSVCTWKGGAQCPPSLLTCPLRQGLSLSLSKPHHLCPVSAPHACTGTLTADSLPVEKPFQFVFLLPAVRFVSS